MRLPVLIAAALALVPPAWPAPQALGVEPGARVWEAVLVIPTYELGPADPNPAYPEWRRRARPVYPYPVLDSFTNRRVEKSYRAVFLENEYLKVTVLPEMGGKLYAIFDKTAGRDVLYTNHVVKYGLVGIRGAWCSGGIEWNFPDGHTVTTVSPVDYTTRSEADGSATVVVGDTERIQGMQWAVAIRLRPGRKWVETEVTLHNRRETPGRYWFWATAAAPAADDLRFVYPMREAYPHVFWPVFSFPKEKGTDLGAYREVPNALSLFARNSLRDFFGVYYEKSDWGIVHVADHREVPGKKTWTWGTDDAGRIWVEKLTDSDGQYVEFQAGRFQTQMEHEFLAPHRVERFTEYWFPVNGLGGAWDEANRNGALRVSVVGNRARITANLNARFADAQLTVEAGGAALHSATVNLGPEAPLAASIELPAPAASGPLTILLKGKDGEEIIRYRSDLPVDGNPQFRPATRPAPDPAVPTSAEQAYVRGLAADKRSQEAVARTAYREALQRDPGFAPAHTALSLSLYRSGDYDAAARHLEAALRRNPEGGEAHYYLGLVRRAQGRNQEAAEQLMWCVRAGYREPSSRGVLGEMALRSGSAQEAIEHLSQAVMLEPRAIRARTLLALAQRITGRLHQAQATIEAVGREMPLDYLALRERALVYEALGLTEKSRQVAEELARLLAREPDSVLELAFDYLGVGRPGEAGDVLEGAIRGAGARVYPLLHYTLGYLYEQGKNPERARAQYALGARGDPAFVFPHRVEEVTVLRAALAANPNDGRAAYYLGNALAALHRVPEALPYWRAAAQREPSNAVAQRNLAWALWTVEGSKDHALQAFDWAVAAAPGDFHLWVERDQLLAEMKQTAGRILLLEQAPAEVKSRSAVVQRLAAAYVEAARYRDAAALLEGAHITSGEGETLGLSIYRRAQLGLAREHQKAGRHAEAAAAFLKATEYPRNLGVGRPATRSHAREYVAAADELEKAGPRDEARRVLERAAEEPLNVPSNPSEPWSEHYYYKALALERVGRGDEARALYHRLAALADQRRMLETEPIPPSGAIRFLLAGLGLEALGEKQQARSAFQQALELDPENELARMKLGQLGP